MSSELSYDDLRLVLSHMPKDLRTLLRAHPLFLGGGFVRATIAGESASDFDLFGANPNDMRTWADELGRDRHAHAFVSPNAITLLAPPRLPVQFITRWTFKTALELIRSFDFTVCQAAVYFEGGVWRSVCSPTFYQDLAAHRLVYTAPVREEEVGGSLLRAVKFLGKGYHISPENLAAVVARLVGVLRFEDLERHPQEERAAWTGRVITGLLREVDPLALIDGLEAVAPPLASWLEPAPENPEPTALPLAGEENEVPF